jgi:hypothetical protein
MSTFRCSAGHQSALTFSGEQVSLPCPTCGTDVYKFRDAVLHDEGLSPVADAAGAPAAGKKRWSLEIRREMRVALGGGVLLLVAAAFFVKRPAQAPVAASNTPVLPAVAVRKAPPPKPEDVSISDFSATANDAGVVKVSFRLNNRPGNDNDYPGLVIHWHGVGGADQLIRRDAYAHPSLPFTTADVTLELARPQGATGIDVKVAY